MFKKFLSFLLTVILLPATSYAVVTIAAFGTPVADNTDGTSYSGPSGTSSASTVLVAFVSATGTVASATMTGGSLTWTREASQLYNTTSTIYVFWAKSGAGGSVSVVFDCTGDSATGANIVVFEVSGADVATSNPIKQFKTSTNASGVPTLTMDAAFVVTNGGVLGIGVARNPAAFGPPTLWTEPSGYDIGHTSPSDGMEGAYVIGETASTITSASGTAGAYGMIVAEVYASGAGPAAPTNQYKYTTMKEMGLY